MIEGGQFGNIACLLYGILIMIEWGQFGNIACLLYGILIMIEWGQFGNIACFLSCQCVLSPLARVAGCSFAAALNPTCVYLTDMHASDM